MIVAYLQARAVGLGPARQQAQQRRSGPHPDVEHPSPRPHRYGSGQQHGIDGGTVSAIGLQQAHPAVQQAVFSDL